MSFWQNLKYKLMFQFGIKPKLSKIVLDNLKKQEEYNKDNVPSPTPIARVCAYNGCKRSLKGLTFKCPYCQRKHCEKHRLPADHGCENPGLPRSMRLGYGTKQSSRQANYNFQGERN